MWWPSRTTIAASGHAFSPVIRYPVPGGSRSVRHAPAHYHGLARSFVQVNGDRPGRDVRNDGLDSDASVGLHGGQPHTGRGDPAGHGDDRRRRTARQDLAAGAKAVCVARFSTKSNGPTLPMANTTATLPPTLTPS